MANKLVMGLAVGLLATACVPSAPLARDPNLDVPDSFGTKVSQSDSITVAELDWRSYFGDSDLVALIDTALIHNQELTISWLEMQVYQSEVLARSGAYLPFVDIDAGAGAQHAGEYSLDGALERVPIQAGQNNPNPLSQFELGLTTTWEIDIWSKLHNAKAAAQAEYLASNEAMNFLRTQLISEVAEAYYELLALDREWEILQRNIAIQSNALRIVRLQKQSAYVTELAVKKFEAEVLHTQSLAYGIQQEITETENWLNFLLGRSPRSIIRPHVSFDDYSPGSIPVGSPEDLLANRPDIRQAELELQAAELNVRVARKNFYPTLRLSGGVGMGAYQPGLVFSSPQSLMYNAIAGLTAPLLNRRDLTALYQSANAKQMQAVLEYERTVLNATMEVNNELAMISNMTQSLLLQSREVDALNASVEVANNLFRSARADYMEVLMTQRDALQSKFEWVETKKQLLRAQVNVYRALGGGWR